MDRRWPDQRLPRPDCPHSRLAPPQHQPRKPGQGAGGAGGVVRSARAVAIGHSVVAPDPCSTRASMIPSLPRGYPFAGRGDGNTHDVCGVARRMGKSSMHACLMKRVPRESCTHDMSIACRHYRASVQPSAQGTSATALVDWAGCRSPRFRRFRTRTVIACGAGTHRRAPVRTTAAIRKISPGRQAAAGSPGQSGPAEATSPLPRD